MPGLFLFLLLCFGSDALEQFQKLRRFLFDAFRGSFLEGYHFGHGRTSPGYDRAARAILPAIAAFLRRGLFHRLGIRHNYFQIQRSEVGYRVIQHRASRIMYVQECMCRTS